MLALGLFAGKGFLHQGGFGGTVIGGLAFCFRLFSLGLLPGLGFGSRLRSFFAALLFLLLFPFESRLTGFKTFTGAIRFQLFSLLYPYLAFGAR